MPERQKKSVSRKAILTLENQSSDARPDGLAIVTQALQALEVLSRLELAGGAPANSVALRRKLEGVCHAFVDGRIGIFAKTPSGANWVNQFPGSTSTSDLDAAFRTGVNSFIAAMRSAGATVSIGTTLRPVERAYLMHYSWRIAKKEIDPANVPALAGVDIEWVHGTLAASRQAAQDMVDGYQIVAKPAYPTKHSDGTAIDMTISWTGTLAIVDNNGTSTSITTTPRTGMNTDLAVVGATYAVIKATFSGDPPHWSDDGH
ncbi:hypothetical protein J2046_006553 [Rhizobium petrolearium]|uniref:hypothetical protein n=1 Tax=Neorhizobium petrolearium TaxID=515361 RepID=UPI001AE5A35C|nr:hypothetical protein [Neorhizobium petrolearium]MBP1848262.1 hypothetical protein [Neorhizobium petrolearium]